MVHYRNRILSVILVCMMILSTPISNTVVLAANKEKLKIEAGSSFVVEEPMSLTSLTIGKGAQLTAEKGQLLTLIVNGTEIAIKEGTYSGDIQLILTEDYSDIVMGSFSQRGGEEFRASLYVDQSGIVSDRSVEETIQGGSYDNKSATGITINSTSDDFNALILTGTEYTLSDATINLLGKSDGSTTNDFSGLGSVIAAYKDAKVSVKNSTITSSGVARPVMFTDDGADSLIMDSTISSMGGELYEGYVNSADQTKMVAPPWVLGITGNARTTNLMGTLSTNTVVRTKAYANSWGVLSTDSGSDMVLTVVDSELTLLGEEQKDSYSENYGSGYGTYIIGDAQEYFYGVTFNVGTYASILTGGDATYASSNFTKPLDIYPLKQVKNGKIAYDWMGNAYDAYDVVNADQPVFTGITGLGNNTIINSDAFGFMAHNSGSLTITDNTVVNSDNATFLLKSGDVDITVEDGATINAEDGILLQMIDNDDSIVGADFSNGAPDFNKNFYEAKGYPGINYDVQVSTTNKNTYTFTATDVALNGSMYNGTGYFGGQAADVLKVTLGSGTTLSGDIRSSSIIHVDENGEQNIHFTIDEYYYLGHVANRTFYNGGNDIEVTVKDGASWTVKDTSLLSSLTIDKTSSVNAPKGKVLTMTVNGVVTKVAAGTYTGKIVLSVGDAAMTVLSGKSTISKTTTYENGLVIASDAVISAADGYLLCMTEDGVQKNLVAGVFPGKVIITATEKHIVGFLEETPFGTEHELLMSLFIENGNIVNDKSVISSLNGGTYDSKNATGLTVESNGDKFNGIVVGGNSIYSISDVNMMFTGNGGNDFAGYGSQVMTTDEANVIVSNAYLRTDGVIMPAIFAGGNSTLLVKDSTIITGDEPSTQGVKVPMMAEVPWLLGISGNTRATNVLSTAKVTYQNCYVEANSWGALSTDTCQEGASLTAIDTTVVVKESGYGSYADGGVFNTYTNCTFDVPDYGLIVAAGKCGALFNKGTVVNSDRFGIMWHKNQEGTVTVSDGTVFNTGMTAFLIKSDVANTAYPNLIVDGATINASNGVILHLMESDDPGMNMAGGGPGSDTMWNDHYTVPTVKAVEDKNDTTDVKAAGTVDATFKNMEVNGDIYNTRWTAGQNLSVDFINADITGIISSATQSHTNVAAGQNITPETRVELGQVTATPSKAVSNGMLLSMDATSTWTITDTSYLTNLTLEEGAQIKAAAGYKLTMLVNGKTTPIVAGTYKGNVVLQVTSIFSDVLNTAVYYDAVGYLAAHQITNGTGNGLFNPNAVLTRGQFIVFFSRAYSVEPIQSTENYIDAGSYLPNKVLTREEMYVELYNALKVLNKLPVKISAAGGGMPGMGNADVQTDPLAAFSDAGSLSSNSKEAVTLFVETGIEKGQDGKLNPTSEVTRADMAMVLYQLLIKK